MAASSSSSPSDAPEYLGTVRPTPSGPFAQFSIGDGARKGVLLRHCKDDAAVMRRRVAIAKLIASLRNAGFTSHVLLKNTVRDAGRADERGFRDVERIVARMISGKEPGFARRHGGRREGLTMTELSRLWTSGDLHAEFPDHVKLKKTSGDDERQLGWFNKVRLPDGTLFGNRVVATVTLDDCDHVMTSLPKTCATSASRRAYAQSLRKVLAYAVYPLRLLPTLPIPTAWLPKIHVEKARPWIYPSEDLAVMQQTEIPLVRRLLFGLLAREGMRLSEALQLTWSSLDLDHGVVRLDTNKTADPRSWALDPGTAEALRRWKEMRGSNADKIPRVFPKAIIGKRWPLAQKLREDLELAGVKRPELMKGTKGLFKLRVHDLRGSFVTLALAAGQTEAWVTDRTGHRSSEMIYRYKRAARTAAELNLGWFAPLDQAIPELTPPRQGANRVQTGLPRGTEGHRAHRVNLGRFARRDPRKHAVRASKSGVPQGTSGSNPLLSAGLSGTPLT
jgi:integrase